MSQLCLERNWSCKTFLETECRASVPSFDFSTFSQVVNLSITTVVRCWLITGLNVHSHVDCFEVLVAQVCLCWLHRKDAAWKTFLSNRRFFQNSQLQNKFLSQKKKFLLSESMHFSGRSEWFILQKKKITGLIKSSKTLCFSLY